MRCKCFCRAKHCVADAKNFRRALLHDNERILESSDVQARPLAAASANLIPAFLLPAFKKRTLLLTDLPRLIEVKDDPMGPGPRIKFEASFASGSTLTNTDNAMHSNTAAPQFGHGSRSASNSRPGSRGVGKPAGDDTPEVAGRFVDVSEKGPKGFVVSSVSSPGSIIETCIDRMSRLVTAFCTLRILLKRETDG